MYLHIALLESTMFLRCGHLEHPEMSRPSGEVKVDEKRIDQGEVEFERNIILAIGKLLRKLMFREVDLVLWNFGKSQVSTVEGS